MKSSFPRRQEQERVFGHLKQRTSGSEPYSEVFWKTNPSTLSPAAEILFDMYAFILRYPHLSLSRWSPHSLSILPSILALVPDIYANEARVLSL